MGKRSAENGYHRSATDSVTTPKYITDALCREFGVQKMFDPCPYDPLFNKDTSVDGLTIPWASPVTFVNPPYSKPRKWLLKARDVWKQGKTVILLLKAESMGSQYFKYAEGAEIRVIDHHVKFGNYKNKAPFTNILVIFHANKTSQKWRRTNLELDQQKQS